MHGLKDKSPTLGGPKRQMIAPHGGGQCMRCDIEGDPVANKVNAKAGSYWNSDLTSSSMTMIEKLVMCNERSAGLHELGTKICTGRCSRYGG